MTAEFVVERAYVRGVAERSRKSEKRRAQNVQTSNRIIMLQLITAAALAQTWSYGYFKDAACTVAGTSISLDGQVKEATGLAIGQCLKNKFGSLEWSYKLSTCSADANGTPSMNSVDLRCASPSPVRIDFGVRPLHRLHRV